MGASKLNFFDLSREKELLDKQEPKTDEVVRRLDEIIKLLRSPGENAALDATTNSSSGLMVINKNKYGRKEVGYVADQPLPSGQMPNSDNKEFSR